MTSSPNVLIFTYSHYGQANINLAIAYELALAGIGVYISSFAQLRPRVSRLQELIAHHASCSGNGHTGSITFRECKGNPLVDGLTLPHPRGVSGALKSYSRLDTVLFPWSLEEYAAIMESCKDIIASIKPNLVVTDMVFYPGVDACRLVNQKFVIASPNSIYEVATAVQPNLAALWKYPVVSSGFPFPLRWWQIPLNIYLSIRLVMYVMTSAKIKQIQAFRGSLVLDGSLAGQPRRGVVYISPALIETDLPYAEIPEELRLCGPIITPSEPLEESDPALREWLDNGPTVLINLGSLFASYDKVAREIASAIRILMDYHDRNGARNIQVLWKAKVDGAIQTVIDEIIGKELNEGRIKILAWLEAEPVSILQHPNVVCTVHHGGANSFYEGIWCGLPHIVLAVWYDTYDYANRVEYLNVGVFGNKTSAPGVQAEEFGQALVRVTRNSEEAAKFRASAKHLKEICRAKGNGRELASAIILKELGSEVLSSH